jgi:hypothetical protein
MEYKASHIGKVRVLHRPIFEARIETIPDRPACRFPLPQRNHKDQFWPQEAESGYVDFAAEYLKS